MIIEKGIAIPPITTRKVRPFMQMVVGDSVLIEDQSDFTAAMAAARKVASRKKWRFTSRPENNSLRIWRAS